MEERKRKERKLRDLWLSGLDGDRLAYDAFLIQMRERLMGYFEHKLKVLGHSPSAAEDLSQETLIGVHEARMDYDRTRSLMAWVFAIARYRLIHHLRPSWDIMKNYHYVSQPIETVEIAIGDGSFGSVESRIDVEKFMAKLSPQTQQAIRLVKIEEMSVAGAARLSGKTDMAIKKQVNRGMKYLSALAA